MSDEEYRDDQGRLLYCPNCGGLDPFGYPWEVLYDGEPDPNELTGQDPRP